MTRQALIVGCGYLGSRVAQAWTRSGTQVWGVTRTPERAAQLERLGVRPIVWNILDFPPAPRNLPPFDQALYAVGYDRRAPYSRADLHLQGLAHVLRLLQECPPSHFLFISTTGVYGGADGRWVDEDSPCEPSSESGRVYVQAEHALNADPLASQSVMLRLAGIYGPGRIPRPTPMANDEQRYLNLVHVDDAVAAVLHVAQASQPPALYNVADGQPVTRQEFRQAACRLCGTTANKNVAHSAAAVRGGQNKRVCSDRIRRQLGFQFRYPDYESGLAAIARAAPGNGC